MTGENHYGLKGVLFCYSAPPRVSENLFWPEHSESQELRAQEAHLTSGATLARINDKRNLSQLSKPASRDSFSKESSRGKASAISSARQTPPNLMPTA